MSRAATRRLLGTASLLFAAAIAARGQESPPSGSPPVAPTPASADAGSFEFLTFDSKVLKRTVEVGVYLPNGYAASPERRYPSLYFFHGRNGISRQSKGHELPKQIDALIANGTLPPTVFVFPNAGGSMYVDWRDGSSPWQEFFATELIAAIDDRYRTIADRALRAVEGDAAGGLGALVLAFRHPELFGAVATHAAAIYPLDPSQSAERLAPRAFELEPIFGRPIDVAWWRRYHPLDLAATQPVESLQQLQIYFDCSEEDLDGFDAANVELHHVLEQRGVPHEWHSRPWAARREYLQENLGESLAFQGRLFAAALKARTERR